VFFEGSPCNPEYGGKGIFAFRGGGLEGIGGERRRMGDVRMERGEVLCCVTAQPASYISILTFPFFYSPFSFLFDYSFALIEQFSSCFPFFYKIDFRTFGKNLIEAIDIII
ncbi:hypothetical protein AAA117_18395, partial [Bacteroides salyersiae]